MKRFFKYALPLLALLAAAAGCTNNPPRILDLWWLPVTAEDGESEELHRELMLYVQVDDEEGGKDLAEIRLENPDSGTYWKTDSSLWSQWKEKGELWVGSSRFVTYGDALAEGDYLLTLEDKGGRVDEIPLTLKGWYGEEELNRFSVYFDGDTGKTVISSTADGWFLLPLEGEDFTPRDVPVGTEFNAADYLEPGEESFCFFLFERNRMSAYKIGPYSLSSAE